jgi:hypothetical protein
MSAMNIACNSSSCVCNEISMQKEGDEISMEGGGG